MTPDTRRKLVEALYPVLHGAWVTHHDHRVQAEAAIDELERIKTAQARAAAQAPPPEPSPCKSCGAPVLFVTTEAGKTAPLSVASKEKRAVIIDGRMRMVDTWISHFADCPTAQQHRKEPAP